MNKLLAIMMISLLFVFAGPIMAQTSSDQEESSGGAQSADEIAKKLANPNATLGTLTFELDYINFGGDLPNAGDQNAVKLSFQPSLPKSLGPGVNFFARPLVPLIFKQDVPIGIGEYDNVGVNLGDIGFDAAIGKGYRSGLILIGGVVGTLPTATDDAIAGKQVRLGPEGLVGINKPWGFLGLLVTHQWQVATVGDRDSYATSLTAGQYFYTFNIKNGWQISTSPGYSYNHLAAKSQAWTFPVGVGIKKTHIHGSTPWKYGLEYYYYAVKPDAFGPSWQIRFSFGPVVPLPW